MAAFNARSYTVTTPTPKGALVRSIHPLSGEGSAIVVAPPRPVAGLLWPRRK